VYTHVPGPLTADLFAFRFGAFSASPEADP